MKYGGLRRSFVLTKGTCDSLDWSAGGEGTRWDGVSVGFAGGLVLLV